MITSNMAKLSPECLALVQNTAHTLIAGTTGSGKSVLLNTILYSMIKNDIISGKMTEFVMIDPKRVELKQYKKYKQCSRYVTEPEDALDTLDDVIDVMEDRYAEMVGKESTDHRIYVVIDELADLLDTPGILERIVKLGRLGRAAHIHLLMCTQDPSRHTLSAQIMQNVTTAVALRCKKDIESKQIIDAAGAEKLPRYGKAIVYDQDGYHTIRIPMIPDEDINELIESTNIGLEGHKYDWIENSIAKVVKDARTANAALVW